MRRAWLLVLISILMVATAAKAQQEPLERTLELLRPVAEATPREVVNIQLRLQNNNEVMPWNVEPQIALPRGWQLLAPTGQVTLEPGTSLTLVLPILVSATASAGSYTFPIAFRTVNSEPRQELLFTVQVREVKRVEVAVLTEPPMAAMNYAVTFLVSNHGNSGRELLLNATSSHNLHLDLQTGRLDLQPGESREVTIEARLPTDLTAKTTHVITLTVRDSSEEQQVAISRSSTELIPRTIPDTTAFHHFPLTIRASGSMGESTGASGLAGTTPTLEIVGRGPLSHEVTDQLGLRLEVSLEEGLKHLSLDYRRSQFELSVGKQAFTAIPLTPAVEAYGVKVNNQWALNDSLALTAELAGFLTNENINVSTAVSINYLGQAQAKVAVVAAPGELVATLQGSYTPTEREPSLLHLSRVTGAYGARLAEGLGGIGHGVEFSVRFKEGVSSAELGIRSTSAGFASRPYHSASFSATGSFLLNEALRVTSEYPIYLQLNYAEEWRWDATTPYAAGPSGPRHGNQSYGVALSTRLGPVQATASYRMSHEMNGEGKESEQEALARLGLSIGERALLSQKLRWTRAVDQALAVTETLDYSVSASLQTGLPGHWVGEIGATYDLRQRTTQEVTFGVTWLASLGPNLHFGTEGELTLLRASTTIELGVNSRYEFRNGQNLELELALNTSTASPPAIAFGLAYALPLNAPLYRLPNMGEITGTVLDARGRPLTGLIVTVAGQATTIQPDGSYRFPAVPAGQHRLSIVTNGVLGSTQLLTPSSPVEVHVEEGTTSQISFDIVDGAAVTGRIRLTAPESERGNELIGQDLPTQNLVAGIQLELRNDSEIIRARTDSSGVFAFRQLTLGLWRLRVLHPGLPAHYAIEAAEQQIDLRAGETEDVVIDIVSAVRRIQLLEGGILQDPNTD